MRYPYRFQAALRPGQKRSFASSLLLGLTALLVLTGSAQAATATALILTSSCPTSGQTQPVTFRASIQAGGTPATAATGTVTFRNGGVPFGTVSVANGGAYSVTVANLPVGAAVITAEYSGDGQLAASTGGGLTQTVLTKSGAVFTGANLAITFDASAAVTSVRCTPTNQEIKSSSQGFYIYQNLTATSVALNNMAQLGGNRVLVWSADGAYYAIFQVTPGRYFKIELVHLSNNPQTGDIDATWRGRDVGFALSVSTPSGYTVQNLTLDGMASWPGSIRNWYYTGGNIKWHWENVEYSQVSSLVAGTGTSTFPISAGEPMGAIAFYLSANAAEHDDILADLWSSEPAMPRPNRANQTWTRADVTAWLDRYERELVSGRTLTFEPKTPADFYKAADRMYAAGMDELYLFNAFWGGNREVDHIDTQWFPNGLSDLEALQQYCAQRGIRMSLHAMSGFMELDDPHYGPLSPTGLSPEISRWATGTLLEPVTAGSTHFKVKPDAGCELIVSPPPWGQYSKLYPPYYNYTQGLISIGNDMITATTAQTNPSEWAVSNVSRTNLSQYGAKWGTSHPAGTRVDFLLTRNGATPLVDSRSDLLKTLAARYARLANKINFVLQNYDGQEYNYDLSYLWGAAKFAGKVTELLDHPTLTECSSGFPSFGHFESMFNRVRSQFAGFGDYAAHIRLNDPRMSATSIDEIHYLFGRCAAAGQRYSFSGAQIGLPLNTIDNYGAWTQATDGLKLWGSVGPYLDSTQKTTLATWGGASFYEPSETATQWLLTPRQAMLRTGLDVAWSNMQEWGPISPRQFTKIGAPLSGLQNPFAAQTPQVELFVLPAMSPDNAANVSLLPALAGDITRPATEQQPLVMDVNGVLALSTTNSSGSQAFFTPSSNQAYWQYKKSGAPAVLDLSACRGLALTVTGDNSGADLVFRVSSNSSCNGFLRDYVVPINFTGTRTIEIPNGEVMWYKKDYGFMNDYDTVGMNINLQQISAFQAYIGKVPAGKTVNVQISAVKAMQEDRSTGLVNPALVLNGATVNITGTVAYNQYLVYAGGSTAKVYDANWHYLKDLPASGSPLSAATGANSFQVNAPASPNTWVSSRLKVSGTPWVINKPAALHHWNFENNLTDSLGTAHGSAVNAPAYVGGKAGVASLRLNGTNQSVTVPDAADLRFTSSQSFTLAAWVKLDRLPGAWAGIVNKGRTAYGLWVTPANRWAFGGATDIVSPVSATAGEWHLLTAVQDGPQGIRKLYVDGLLSASGPVGDASATRPLLIGATSDAVPGDFLPGCVDDVRLYNTVLSAEDIKKLNDGARQTAEMRNLAASGVGPTSAVLNASLNGAGKTYTVYACWGPVNGGNVPAQWAATANLGTFSNAVWTTVLSHTPAGLLPNTPYYFTWYAVNAADQSTLWAPQAYTFTTLPGVPLATPQSVTVAEDAALNVTLGGSATDGGALTYSLAAYPAHGSLIGAPPNLRYTPVADYFGADRFTFTVNDGSQDSVAATVSITVSPVNDAPVPTPQSIFTLIGTARTVKLGGTDRENDALTCVVIAPPAHGTLSGSAPNLIYTPAPGYSGADAFTFKVNDGQLDSAAATVEITVRTAQTLTWSTTAASTTWSTGANWVGGISPVAGDDVILFGRSAAGAFAPTANTDFATTTLNSLNLQSGVDGDVALSLAQGVQVDGGGIVNQATATLTLPTVTMTANQTWSGTGPIICQGVAGASRLTAAGASLQINGSSTHSGGTTVTSGNLKLGHASALGAGDLAWQSVGGTFTPTVEMSTGTGLANAITLATDLTLDTPSGNLLLSGVLSGAGKLTKTGGNTLTLTNPANSYTGGTSYAGGLAVTAQGALGTGSVTGAAGSNLSFNIPADASFGNTFTTASGNAVPVISNLSATSTVTLTGNNVFGTGSTWAIFAGVPGAEVVLTGSNSFQNRPLGLKNIILTVGTTGSLGSTGLIKFADDSGVSSALYLRNGVALANAIQDTQYATYTNTCNMTVGVVSGAATLSGTLDLHKGASSGTANWSLDAGTDAVLTCSGVVKTSNLAMGTVALTKTGPGTVILSGANTYAGNTTVAEGTLSFTQVNTGDENKRMTIASGAFLDLNHTQSDTVGTFYIDSVQQSRGTFVADGTQTGAEIGTPRITGTGKLVVTTGRSRYAAWILGYGVGPLSSIGDDFDGDGIPNAVEKVLGSDPTLANEGLTLISAGKGVLKYRHEMSTTLAPDLMLSYQWSTNLVEWRTSGQSNTAGTSATIETVTVSYGTAPANNVREVTVTLSGTPSSKLFMRMVVTQLP